MAIKIKYEPFVSNGSSPNVRSYYVYAANGDGTESKLLGIVTGSGAGRKIKDWGTDTVLGTRFRTRGEAAQSLLAQHRDRLSKPVRPYEGRHRSTAREGIARVASATVNGMSVLTLDKV